eukprot:1182912-Prymnesium_polylepis.1
MHDRATYGRTRARATQRRQNRPRSKIHPRAGPEAKPNLPRNTRAGPGVRAQAGRGLVGSSARLRRVLAFDDDDRRIHTAHGITEEAYASVYGEGRSRVLLLRSWNFWGCGSVQRILGLRVRVSCGVRETGTRVLSSKA